MKQEMRNVVIACNELARALSEFAESQKEKPAVMSGFISTVSREEVDALTKPIFPEFTESAMSELEPVATMVPKEIRTAKIDGTMTEFKMLFARALNTLDPQQAPEWAIELSDLLNRIPMNVDEVKINFTLKC